jgi:membrane protease YdiL (CAAX protease family)
MSDAVSRLRATGAALALGVGGLVVMSLWAAALTGAADAAGVDAAAGTPVGSVLVQVATLAGAVTVAVPYLVATDRGLEYLDLAVPDRRALGYLVGGVAAIVGLALLAEAALEWLGVALASHSVEEQARAGDPTFLLALVPGALLFVGPGEELLYRNLVQKSLAEVFPAWRAISLTSAVFALVHVGVFAPGDAGLSVWATLAVAFALSTVLGVVYHRTRSLAVAALVHGAYDALVFGSLYLQYA